jgi:citrate lyase beta subunit
MAPYINMSPTVADLSTLRSLLFVPGGDERKLAKAFASEADAVVADLEDGVAPAEKERARAVAARVLASAGARPAPMLRVNAGSRADLEAAAALPLTAIVVPKATPAAIAALGGGEAPVLALVESAAGLQAAYEVASARRVAALMLGPIDLGAELGLEPRAGGEELLYARSKLVVDSAAAGVRPPFDGVFPDIRDSAGLAAEVELARSLGLRGKGCIHPAQLETVNRGFAPRAERVAWARAVIAAYERGLAEGKGAVGLDGEMIDLPVAKRARRILDEHERREG